MNDQSSHAHPDPSVRRPSGVLACSFLVYFFWVVLTPSSDPPGVTLTDFVPHIALLLAGAAVAGLYARPGTPNTVYGACGGALLAMITIGGSRFPLDLQYGLKTLQGLVFTWLACVIGLTVACRLIGLAAWRWQRFVDSNG